MTQCRVVAAAAARRGQQAGACISKQPAAPGNKDARYTAPCYSHMCLAGWLSAGSEQLNVTLEFCVIPMPGMFVCFRAECADVYCRVGSLQRGPRECSLRFRIACVHTCDDLDTWQQVIFAWCCGSQSLKPCVVQSTCCGQQEKDFEACQHQLFTWGEAPRRAASEYAVWGRFHGSQAAEVDNACISLFNTCFQSCLPMSCCTL